MASKKPLCLYSGKTKQLQPGDTLIGAYNATEAGWVVNASGWLVATPGTVKLVDRVVCGSIYPVTSGGIKLFDVNDNVILFTSPSGNLDHVGIGSALTVPNAHLHLMQKGSAAVEQRFTNDTTGHLDTDGFEIGLDANEDVYVYNNENSRMYFGTNQLLRMAITSDGIASVNTLRSGPYHGLSTASIDGAVTVGGDFSGINASLTNVTMRNGGILYTDRISARDSGGLWLTEDGNTGIFIEDSTGDVELSASMVVRGNASVDGNLTVGGTGMFGNSVTITADVQVAAGQKFYMDGGADTYWTASNDVITGHVNSATVINFGVNKAHFTNSASVDVDLYVGGNLHVTGSLNVHASTLYLGDNQFGDAQTDQQQLYGIVTIDNAGAANPLRITGNASISGTGYVDGTMGIGGDTTMNASLWVLGNASIDGNLVVGGTGAFGNSVTITEDVQVDAGRYLYLDGGLDTYLTASLDKLTIHAGTASIVRFTEGGISVGSPVTAPIADRIAQFADKKGNCLINIGDATTGYTDSDGIRFGTQGSSFAELSAFDAPWRITSQGTLAATLTNASLILANGMTLETDQVRARDAGGLWLNQNTASAGMFIEHSTNYVSIGSPTANPAYALDIYHPEDNTLARFMSADNNAYITIKDDTQSMGLGVQDNDVVIRGNSSQKLVAIDQTTQTMVVAGSVVASAFILEGGARLIQCSLNASGDITAGTGADMMLNQHDDTSPNQEFIAEKVWNAVYNDVVDWQDLKEGAEVKYGKVYVDSYDGAHLPTGRCQLGVMGICSDTFGFAVGRIQGRSQIPVSVSGWCLAYVDKMYKTGIPLTNTSSGCLTEMNATEKMTYPERLVAVYKRPESEEVWQGKVETKNRHWVQVK